MRQVRDSASRASKRALESSAETLLRQEQDRVCARKRASLTQAETLLRQEEDRVRTAHIYIYQMN